ncbi:DUF1850 domain-containing protein [Tabrizicola piscis]|uniref:DUF1850 domain-containing protein n=2 Tax=Tabrizicola piscis TaxID=2494374 RepID=A0A3S8U8Q8_9RHOB|nr:DUF1850 domain-containing protein [Tabrizicola piscis]
MQASHGGNPSHMSYSVEKTRWRQCWQIEAAGLRLAEAAVKGSGAGMEPGDGARLEGGWWVWNPRADHLPSLTLATSGASDGGWLLCGGGTCQDIPETGGFVQLRPCP